jgi:hypothetical protein
MKKQYSISPIVLEWLLEPDRENPSIRYFAMRDLLDEDAQGDQLSSAASQIMQSGPVATILAQQQSDGFWEEPGPGYYPKYTGTVWSLIMLAQLGADPGHAAIRKACEYVLTHARTKDGYLSAGNSQMGAVHCLQGNLAAALIDLGSGNDARMECAIDWMARSVTGEGFASSDQKKAETHYIRSGISGPGFRCSSNGHEPCAWGAVKVGLALSKIPPAMRTPSVEKAITSCCDFLLSVDTAAADYPHPFAEKPSTSWFKFGFPIFYVTDLLQNLAVLLALGNRGDARLANAIRFVENQSDEDGRWRMTYSYNGKTWVDIEKKGQPSKWVTLRALSVLKRYYAPSDINQSTGQ